MNEDQKSLQIIRRPKLTKAQKDLFQLICEKLENNDKILYSEAESIWINKVCKRVVDGVPYYWNYWKNRYEENGEVRWRGEYEPMPKEWIPSRVLLWLTANIGSLVLKGHLKVIPMIELKQYV